MVTKINADQLRSGSGSNVDADMLDGKHDTAFQAVVEKNQPGGYAGLDTGGLLPSAKLNPDVYTMGNVLGTVSQLEGVPTGAIIERGSNANGEYIKFADGTMICFAKALSATNLTLNVWKEYIYTLPAAFYSAPVVSPDLSIVISWAAIVGMQSGGSSATQVTILLVTTSAGYTSLNNGVQYIAIGRWF